MKLIGIKSFEISPYDNDSYIVKNPSNSSYEIISEYQVGLLRKLQKDESFVSVLFPFSGIAKKEHIKLAFSLFEVLKKLRLLTHSDLSEKTSSTQFTPLNLFSKSFYLNALNPIAAFLLSSFGRVYGILPVWIQSALLWIVFLFACIFIPPNLSKDLSLHSNGFFYFGAIIYLSICFSLSLRAFFRVAFVFAQKREAYDLCFKLHGPIVSLSVDGRDSWMLGVRGRIQLAIIGLLATVNVSLLSFALYSFEQISYFSLVAICLGNALTIILLLCPYLLADGAELLTTLLCKDRLRVDLSYIFWELFYEEKKYVFAKFFSLLLFSVFWFYLWTELWKYSFAKIHLYLQSQFDLLTNYFLFPLLPVFYIEYFVLSVPLLFIFYKLILAYRLSNKARNQDGIKLSERDKELLLQKIPLFSVLPVDKRQKVVAELTELFFRPGKEIVCQGDTENDLYILVTGEAVAIYNESEESDGMEIGRLSAGDAFGEVGLIDGMPRTASIVAVKDCAVLKLSKSTFDNFMRQEFQQLDRVKQLIRLSSFFKRHPLFSKMSSADQAFVIERFQYLSVNSQQKIISSEDEEIDFYVVYQGRLIGEFEDSEQEFSLLPEDCFGYMRQGKLRVDMPNVRAVVSGGLLRLSQQEFRQLIWDKLVSRPDIFS